MSRKEKLREQYQKLHAARTWIFDRLRCDEGDKLTREALFKSQQAIGLALLLLEEVEFRTDGAYNKDD